jgi:putative peptide zinc metalloprotease protein
MGLQRKTFSESWYRVADLKPVMHPSLKVWRQTYRGDLWFVLEDPVNNVYFRVNYPAYEFLALLSGKRTVSEVWHICLDMFGDEAPTQGEIIQLLGQLYTSNLLLGDIPADTQGLLKRHKKRIQKEVTGQIRSFLFLKIPLLDPNHFLKVFNPFVGWLFSPFGLVLWTLGIVFGLIYSLGNVPDLTSGASSILAPGNIPLLYCGFALSKILHEFGHAFACKSFGVKTGTGGHVHKMGVMLMLLTPVPFVDCSSSWAFRSKWQRMVVGMAGMLVDLAVAAACVIIWSQTAEGSTMHSLAYNIMFVTSVSTLLFNGNP